MSTKKSGLARNIVVGAGGHGKVVADILLGWSTEVIGFLDDDATLWNTRIMDLPVLGAIDDYASFSPDQMIMGIGRNSVRYAIVTRLGPEIAWTKAIHRGATIGHFVEIGAGTTVAAGTVINPGARIGKHTIINTAATVDHDCEIGDFVHIAPGAHLAGGVKVGDYSFIGMGANILPYIEIGPNVTIGAGATVVKDVPEGVIAKGIPARW
jgi:sugar O-acyltransferase (sialic acid O-acetyltransferase NeuD family)